MQSDPIHRLFYALQPPRAERNRIVNLVDWPGSHPQPDRLHVTLAITDDFAERPDTRIRAMRNAGDNFAATPFSIAFGQLSGSASSVALRPARRNAELMAFQRSLAASMVRHGAPLRSGWAFRPHVTLSYRDGQPFSRPVAAIGWVAREFVLIHSVVGRTQHFELGRWTLDAAPAADLFHQQGVAA